MDLHHMCQVIFEATGVPVVRSGPEENLFQYEFVVAEFVAQAPAPARAGTPRLSGVVSVAQLRTPPHRLAAQGIGGGGVAAQLPPPPVRRHRRVQRSTGWGVCV